MPSPTRLLSDPSNPFGPLSDDTIREGLNDFVTRLNSLPQDMQNLLLSFNNVKSLIELGKKKEDKNTKTKTEKDEFLSKKEKKEVLKQERYISMLEQMLELKREEIEYRKNNQDFINEALSRALLPETIEKGQNISRTYEKQQRQNLSANFGGALGENLVAGSGLLTLGNMLLKTFSKGKFGFSDPESIGSSTYQMKYNQKNIYSNAKKQFSDLSENTFAGDDSISGLKGDIAKSKRSLSKFRQKAIKGKSRSDEKPSSVDPKTYDTDADRTQALIVALARLQIGMEDAEDELTLDGYDNLGDGWNRIRNRRLKFNETFKNHQKALQDLDESRERLKKAKEKTRIAQEEFDEAERKLKEANRTGTDEEKLKANEEMLEKERNLKEAKEAELKAERDLNAKRQGVIDAGKEHSENVPTEEAENIRNTEKSFNEEIEKSKTNISQLENEIGEHNANLDTHAKNIEKLRNDIKKPKPVTPKPATTDPVTETKKQVKPVKDRNGKEWPTQAEADSSNTKINKTKKTDLNGKVYNTEAEANRANENIRNAEQRRISELKRNEAENLARQRATLSYEHERIKFDIDHLPEGTPEEVKRSYFAKSFDEADKFLKEVGRGIKSVSKLAFGPLMGAITIYFEYKRYEEHMKEQEAVKEFKETLIKTGGFEKFTSAMILAGIDPQFLFPKDQEILKTVEGKDLSLFEIIGNTVSGLVNQGANALLNTGQTSGNLYKVMSILKETVGDNEEDMALARSNSSFDPFEIITMGLARFDRSSIDKKFASLLYNKYKKLAPNNTALLKDLLNRDLKRDHPQYEYWVRWEPSFSTLLWQPLGKKLISGNMGIPIDKDDKELLSLLDKHQKKSYTYRINKAVYVDPSNIEILEERAKQMRAGNIIPETTTDVELLYPLLSGTNKRDIYDILSVNSTNDSKIQFDLTPESLLFHQGGRTPNVPVTLQAGEIFFTPAEGKDLVDKLEQWREVRVGLIKLKNEHSSALREVKEKKGRLAS
jgi:hypothetical protein